MRTLQLGSLPMILLALLGSLNAFSQEPTLPNDEKDSLNEQTIYVPFEKLREVFERDGRGVFLPYDKFQQLWQAARRNQPTKPDLAAPLGALITDIESTATLGTEIVNVDATIKIELLREGWHRIPLRLSQAAIRNAALGEREARIITVENGQYELLVSHDSDQPKTVELKLSYAKALAKTGGQSIVAFQSPQAPVNRWTIRTGQKDIDVHIEPMIASSKKSDDDSNATSDGGDEILAFVGAAPEVKIMWTPKTEGASGLAALISADTQARFQVDQGVARTSATVTLDISRTEINSLSLDIPLDQKVVSIFDRNVKKWEVEKGQNSQTVKIDLFEPTLGRQPLAVELEKFIDEIDDLVISVPQIKANAVSRNSGMVLVDLSAGLRAEPENKLGLLQMDVAELPAELKQQQWEFAYRYASLPYELALRVKKIQPLINVDHLVEVAVRPEKLNIETTAVFDIQLAGVFQLELEIPEEFEIREIRSLSQQGLNSVPVDTFYRDPNEQRRVLVSLGKKAIGKIGLVVSLDRELEDTNLLSPTEVASKIELAIPKAAAGSVEFSKGNVVVYAPESLQVNSAETKGLRNISFNNARARLTPTMTSDGLRPVLAYSFSHAETDLKLEAKRRRPQVTVEQLVVVTVQSGVIKYDARLFYEILYSGVKSLRLDVPTELVDEIRIRSAKLLKQPMQPQPDDRNEGYTAWELNEDTEFFGKHEIRLTWEKQSADLPLGETANLDVDRLIPADVDRAKGQIVLTKSETIDVRPQPEVTGLRPIDPQTDLAQGVSIENAAMAFEFVDDWRLGLAATRFELQDLKRTSISRAVIRAVALRQNELSFQCLYQMRSVGQRISIQMPAGFDAATSFDDQPIRVNGNRVTPERGGPDLIYVPLNGVNSDEPFLLEIRYTLPGTPDQIDLPVFTDDPAVQKVFLCVYLPFERALIHKSGDWTDEAVDEHRQSIAAMLRSRESTSMFSRMFRRRTENVDQYLQWVKSGVNCSTAASQKFEVDGRPYVFSTLRPEPAGFLHLRSINMKLLNVIVFGVIALLGLTLVRSKLSTQLAGTLFVLAIFVAVGVFFPLLTEHLFSEALLLTAGLVGLTWLVSDSLRWIRELRQIRTSRRNEWESVQMANELALAGAGQPASENLGTTESPPNSNEPPAESTGDQEGGSL